MKLSEMLVKLEKDHTKKFKGISNYSNDIICSFDAGCVDFNYNREQELCSDSFRIGEDREWEEVLQPMTFEEVMNNAKVFKCKHQNIKEDGYWILSRFIQMLSIKGFTSSEIIDILKNGKFYN